MKNIIQSFNYFRRYKYPFFKFLISFWLIPLLQLSACLFSNRKDHLNSSLAVIISSRSNKISNSFFCLLPELKKTSVNVVCYSVNYSEISSISKLYNIYIFFALCRKADFIFLDDTFLPVSYALKFKWIFRPKVIQLWHSAGLFKRVGLDHCRGRLITFIMGLNYRNFDLVVVSSEACRDAISGFMGLDKDKVISLGTSYTDRYVNAANSISRKLPKTHKKKVLYAPTFRGDAFRLEPSPIPDVISTFSGLEQDYDCYISPHPHDSIKLNKFNFPFDLSESLNEIDILITDYSSIAMDYMLANPNGRLILFVPDLDMFEETTGFYVHLNEITDQIAYDEVQLSEYIRCDNSCHHISYSEKYLNLCDGKATLRLLQYLGIVYERN